MKAQGLYHSDSEKESGYTAAASAPRKAGIGGGSGLGKGQPVLQQQQSGIGDKEWAELEAVISAYPLVDEGTRGRVREVFSALRARYEERVAAWQREAAESGSVLASSTGEFRGLRQTGVGVGHQDGRGRMKG